MSEVPSLLIVTVAELLFPVNCKGPAAKCAENKVGTWNKEYADSVVKYCNKDRARFGILIVP